MKQFMIILRRKIFTFQIFEFFGYNINMAFRTSYWFIAILSVFSCFVFAFSALAMSSTNYTVGWDSINSGGEDTGSSTNYLLRDTIGEQATGYSSSSNYLMSAGYRTGDVAESYLSFDVMAQDNSTQVSYSSFSTSTVTVVVLSSAGFAIGDYIGVVENLGLSQKIAFGKLINVAGNNLIVDFWDGSPSQISPSSSGGDDFVFKISGKSVTLGTLSQTIGNTSMASTKVTSNAQSGYTVYINDDDNLRYNTSTYITNVSDGSVTPGQEEYGWQVYGTKATNIGSDRPFTTSTQAIQQSVAQAVVEERVGLVFKVSISGATPSGDYSQIVYFTVTANY